jgi:thioredoxin-dependent peroxiredoxin
MQLLTALRVIATSAAATIAGLARIATRRSPPRVALNVGDFAPDFSLTASDGVVYRLSSFRGRQAVVLAWFPKAFTGGCARQCSSIELERSSFEARGVQVFGANVDRPNTNRSFAEALGLWFPILSDPGRTVAASYGVLGTSGFPSRWTFYIDRDGRILAIDKTGETSTHGETIASTLDRLGFVSA